MDEPSSEQQLAAYLPVVAIVAIGELIHDCDLITKSCTNMKPIFVVLSLTA